MEKMKMKKK